MYEIGGATSLRHHMSLRIMEVFESIFGSPSLARSSS